MDYLLYEPEDFASDESYLRYYFKLNKKDIAFWESWISNHPEKLDVIVNADELISLLSFHVSEDAVEKELGRLMSDIKAGAIKITPDKTNAAKKVSAKARPLRYLKIVSFTLAAAVVLVFLARITILAPSAVVDAETPGMTASITKTNNGAGTMLLTLEDSSVVTLKPGSSVTYAAHFAPDKREIMLDGEAFFQVSKNPARPFFVYYGNLVTHVLGTSFNVKIDKVQKKIEVAVRTGRVEVYEKNNKGTSKQNTPQKEKGVVLTPNQKVIYTIDTKSFEATLVDKPMPLLAHHDNVDTVTTVYNISKETFVFKSERLADIIKVLEDVYGIDIQVENDHLNNCHFSGDLTRMDLYGKLDIICKTVGASYKITGTSILIKGKNLQ
ncbi:FecR family protein [Danxiaibacter flavus]|uniref:FecR family protein n=2 Tax=Danxiaibacter flavus TaxID=3049108 RepID=A0ABV3Z9C8_9BACT